MGGWWWRVVVALMVATMAVMLVLVVAVAVVVYVYVGWERGMGWGKGMEGRNVGDPVERHANSGRECRVTSSVTASPGRSQFRSLAPGP